MATLPANAAAYDSIIADAAARYQVPAALVKAIIWRESNFVATATALTGGDATRGGSYGLMQMSLATARALGFTGLVGEPSTLTGLYDPTTNIDLGTKYLRDLLAQTGGNVDATISGYNAGLSSVRADDGKRVGNTGTNADRSTAFINQDYVDWVKSALSRVSVARVAAGGAAIVLVFGAIAALAFLPSSRREKS